MNAELILRDLRAEFPGKPIICLPGLDPKEIVVELGSAGGTGSAIAIIDRSVPHYHKRTTEQYEVQSGRLCVHVGDVTHVLDLGEVDAALVEASMVGMANRETEAVQALLKVVEA